MRPGAGSLLATLLVVGLSEAKRCPLKLRPESGEGRRGKPKCDTRTGLWRGGQTTTTTTTTSTTTTTTLAPEPECLTVSEEPCVFPFTFGGVEHSKCTMDQSVNGLAWCATQVNETTGETMSGRWSDCRSESCPIECTCPEEELSLVCGLDGITYSSECAAHCEKVALNYPGECLPEGGQCRFSEDCRNFSSCNALQDASCICLHGTCEVQENVFAPLVECEASSIFNCSCSGEPENCFCVEGSCSRRGWECHNDVECGRLGKCTELLTPGLAQLTGWQHACQCREAVCEPRDLPFSCQPSNFY